MTSGKVKEFIWNERYNSKLTFSLMCFFNCIMAAWLILMFKQTYSYRGSIFPASFLGILFIAYIVLFAFALIRRFKGSEKNHAYVRIYEEKIEYFNGGNDILTLAGIGNRPRVILKEQTKEIHIPKYDEAIEIVLTNGKKERILLAGMKAEDASELRTLLSAFKA